MDKPEGANVHAVVAYLSKLGFLKPKAFTLGVADLPKNIAEYPTSLVQVAILQTTVTECESRRMALLQQRKRKALEVWANKQEAQVLLAPSRGRCTLQECNH